MELKHVEEKCKTKKALQIKTTMRAFAFRPFVLQSYVSLELGGGRGGGAEGKDGLLLFFQTEQALKISSRTG